MIDFIRIGHIRSGGRGRKAPKIHWCTKCGRDMTFMRDVPAWNCFHCSNIEYLEPPPPAPTAVESPSRPAAGLPAGLMSSDDLTDRQPRPSTGGRAFHSMKDPRSRSQYAKPNQPLVDKEIQDFLDSHVDYHLISYVEHTEQSSNVLSPSELRDKDMKSE